MSDRLAAHGGTLTVRSQPGQGTTITGRLPARPGSGSSGGDRGDHVLPGGATGSYVVPLFHLPKQWVARWTRIKHPDATPITGYQFSTWWSAP